MPGLLIGGYFLYYFGQYHSFFVGVAHRRNLVGGLEGLGATRDVYLRFTAPDLDVMMISMIFFTLFFGLLREKSFRRETLPIMTNVCSIIIEHVSQTNDRVLNLL
jgi:hypothetical protein